MEKTNFGVFVQALFNLGHGLFVIRYSLFKNVITSTVRFKSIRLFGSLRTVGRLCPG